MSRAKSPTKFQFKRFSAWHHRSSMKIGVDGVLIGCWADGEDKISILDVGTGCGVISLIMAQRYPDANITGIDIDQASAEEAAMNAEESPWANRISIHRCAFSDLVDIGQHPFDLIVSNPPYFDSGIADITTRREQARHQSDLSPSVILTLGKDILSDDGGVAIIVPTDLTAGLEAEARSLGYSLTRKCLVRGHKDAPFKRTMLQWNLGRSEESIPLPTEQRTLTLETEPGDPTEEYRTLCKDFYLKF